MTRVTIDLDNLNEERWNEHNVADLNLWRPWIEDTPRERTRTPTLTWRDPETTFHHELEALNAMWNRFLDNNKALKHVSGEDQEAAAQHLCNQIGPAIVECLTWYLSTQPQAVGSEHTWQLRYLSRNEHEEQHLSSIAVGRFNPYPNALFVSMTHPHGDAEEILEATSSSQLDWLQKANVTISLRPSWRQLELATWRGREDLEPLFGPYTSSETRDTFTMLLRLARMSLLCRTKSDPELPFCGVMSHLFSSSSAVRIYSMERDYDAGAGYVFTLSGSEAQSDYPTDVVRGFAFQVWQLFLAHFFRPRITTNQMAHVDLNEAKQAPIIELLSSCGHEAQQQRLDTRISVEHRDVIIPCVDPVNMGVLAQVGDAIEDNVDNGFRAWTWKKFTPRLDSGREGICEAVPQLYHELPNGDEIPLGHPGATVECGDLLFEKRDELEPDWYNPLDALESVRCLRTRVVEPSHFVVRPLSLSAPSVDRGLPPPSSSSAQCCPCWRLANSSANQCMAAMARCLHEDKASLETRPIDKIPTFPPHVQTKDLFVPPSFQYGAFPTAYDPPIYDQAVYKSDFKGAPLSLLFATCDSIPISYVKMAWSLSMAGLYQVHSKGMVHGAFSLDHIKNGRTGFSISGFRLSPVDAPFHFPHLRTAKDLDEWREMIHAEWQKVVSEEQQQSPYRPKPDSNSFLRGLSDLIPHFSSRIACDASMPTFLDDIEAAFLSILGFITRQREFWRLFGTLGTCSRHYRAYLIFQYLPREYHDWALPICLFLGY